MLRFTTAALAVVSVASIPTYAAADACAPREIVQLTAPQTGATVRPSARFRLWLSKGCSAIPEGPPSQFRIVDARGRVAPHQRRRWAGQTELAPLAPLSPGAHRLEWRHAVSKTKRGPWKVLATVTVAGALDKTPPRFPAGMVPRASARAKRGLVALSPCHVKKGWRLERRLTLQAATDASSDELLYSVSQWRPKKGKRSLRVVYTGHHRAKAGAALTLSWTDDGGFDQRVQLWVCVRDLSGNHSCTARPTELRTPRVPKHDWLRRWLR